jgi:hypothetical protein
MTNLFKNLYQTPRRCIFHKAKIGAQSHLQDDKLDEFALCQGFYLHNPAHADQGFWLKPIRDSG